MNDPHEPANHQDKTRFAFKISCFSLVGDHHGSHVLLQTFHAVAFEQWGHGNNRLPAFPITPEGGRFFGQFRPDGGCFGCRKSAKAQRSSRKAL